MFIYICDNDRAFLFLTLEVVLSHLQQSMDAKVGLARTGCITNKYDHGKHPKEEIIALKNMICSH